MKRITGTITLAVFLFATFQLYSCNGSGSGSAEEPAPIIMSLNASTITPCSVELQWSAYGGQYQVWVDDSPYAYSWGRNYYSENVEGLIPEKRYCFWIEAWEMYPSWPSPYFDFLGVSNTLCTDLPPDIIPPSSPTRIKAVSDAGSQILLTWDTNSTDDCALANYRAYQDGAIYYRVYRDGVINHDLVYPPYIDTNINPGTSYNYQVVAVDSSGNESGKTLNNFISTAWSSSIDYIYSGQHAKHSIALDSSGKAYVSYYSAGESGGASGAIKYTTNASGNWKITTITEMAPMQNVTTSLALDSEDKVHIVYTEGYYDLKYATNKSGNWTIETIESNWAGLYPSLAIDAMGYAHVSYNRYGFEDLKYATNASGSWITTILTNVKYEWGKRGGTAIALDTDNNVHIAFHDDINIDLKYATNSSGSWIFTTLDSVGDVGNYPSLCIDKNNQAHISYHDISNNSLKYITNVSGSWDANTIDANGAGLFNSITCDNNDYQHISYYGDDITDGHGWTLQRRGLMYATNGSGVWQTHQLHGAYGWTAIASDSLNRAHIVSCPDPWPYADLFYSIYSPY